MFSSGSLEEAGGDSPVMKARVERRRSDPHDYGGEKSIKHFNRSGSGGYSPLTHTRRDKTTGIILCARVCVWNVHKLFNEHPCIGQLIDPEHGDRHCDDFAYVVCNPGYLV